MTTTTSSPSTVIAIAEPLFTNAEPGIGGFPGRVRRPDPRRVRPGPPRQYASWCRQHHVRLFDARRPDIECFARDLEARGRGGPQ